MAPERLHDLPPGAFRHVSLALALRDELAPEVRRHDHHRVLEVHGAALSVGQAPVVEQLEQDVQHVRMRFLDFIEEDDGVRTAAYGLRQLTGLLVAHIAGRRAEHARDRVLLLVLGHVDPDHRLLVVEEKLGQRPGELRLADAGWPEEQEAAERPMRVLQAGSRAANGIRHGVDRFVLPDDPVVQAILHMNELLDFALHQPTHGDVGPLAHHVSDVLLVDLFLEHPLALLEIGQLRFDRLDPLLELGHRSVLQLRRFGVVAAALRAFDVQPHPLELLTKRPRLLDRAFLLLPM